MYDTALKPVCFIKRDQLFNAVKVTEVQTKNAPPWRHSSFISHILQHKNGVHENNGNDFQYKSAYQLLPD